MFLSFVFGTARLLRHDEGNARSLAKITKATALERDTRVMRHIISQRYCDDMIRDRNTHLAQDMVDQAIVRKNERMMRTRGTGTPAAATATATATAASSGGGGFSFLQTATTSKSDHFGQMVLTAADFDVKTMGIEERDARRAEVDAEIADMVGWGSKP